MSARAWGRRRQSRWQVRYWSAQVDAWCADTEVEELAADRRARKLSNRAKRHGVRLDPARVVGTDAS